MAAARKSAATTSTQAPDLKPFRDRPNALPVPKICPVEGFTAKAVNSVMETIRKKELTE